jgi:hypothetical protein
VSLETVVSETPTLLSYDGTQHSERALTAETAA